MFKPMLAAKFDWKDPDLAMRQMEAIRFPVFGSPKIDGIRGHISDGVVLSRKNKPIPNIYVQSLFGKNDFNKLDGELVVGAANDNECFNRTQSGVMSQDGQPDVTYFTFDRICSLPFYQRISWLPGMINSHPRIKVVRQIPLLTMEAMLKFEADMLDFGYEGIMMRDLEGPYKQGRSTLREGWLIKLKRFEDSEAEILGCYEQETNNNIAVMNEVGNMKRSSHKENKVTNGRLGGFYVRDINSGIEFDVGTLQGVTNASRVHMWSDFLIDPTEFLGRTIVYKYLKVGTKDKPRHPIFKGFRED